MFYHHEEGLQFHCMFCFSSPKQPLFSDLGLMEEYYRLSMSKIMINFDVVDFS